MTSAGTRSGTKSGTIMGMPALNVSFDDTEMEILRAAAQEADESLKDFVHNAALLRADRHRQQVAAAAQMVAERSAELNRRLRDK